MDHRQETQTISGAHLLQWRGHACFVGPSLSVVFSLTRVGWAGRVRAPAADDVGFRVAA